MDLPAPQKSRSKMMLKDSVLALSLSNLCFISTWRLLLMPSAFSIYHQKVARPPVDYVAIILDVFVLAALFFISIVIARRSRNGLLKKGAKAAFIVLLSLPMYGLLSQIDNGYVRHLLFDLLGNEVTVRRLLFSVPLTISLFLPLIALRRIDRAARIGVTFTLILAPLIPLNISQAVVIAMNHDRAAAGNAASPVAVTTERGRPRVLWMVFDEFDYRAAFANRPATVKLPELDRLATTSLLAENAYPPAAETFLTMPALITGRLVAEATRSGPGELMLRFGDDAKPVPWSTQPNIFSRAREAGFNTALVGWRHPYCRILGSSLTKCAWEGYDSFKHVRGLAPRMYSHALTAAPVVTVLSPPRNEVGDIMRKKHVADFNGIYQQAIQAAIDPNLGLVMVHWPIPHPPIIYDRSADKISVDAGHSYLDNLELMDRTIGDIRRAMENNGTWDNTVVIVSSDHWWRVELFWKKGPEWTREEESVWGGTSDRRIPFILKLADKKRASFAAPFNTVLTHDLILAILLGEVSDTKGAGAWIERHRSIGRSPYDEYNTREGLLRPTESLVHRILRPKPSKPSH